MLTSFSHALKNIDEMNIKKIAIPQTRIEECFIENNPTFA